MTPTQRSPLISALIDPAVAGRWSAGEWNDILILAREHALLPRLAAQLMDAGLFASAPKKARSHMHAASISAESTHTAIRFEVNRVLRALAEVDAPVVLLKGAGYVIADLPIARGRFVGDLDFMVPRDRIDEVEETLVRAGWMAAEMDEYDQRYYREWAHEIPPLQHPERDTPLDVHHTIVALTSRFRPNAEALFAASEPLGHTRLSVLSPADMVLHSTVHLFNDEVGRPLRDLLDQHGLLTHFASRPGFWDELLARARLHGLGRPVYYMLRQTQRVFGTPVPPDVQRVAASWAPGPLLNFIMDRLFALRFSCEPVDRRRPAASLANGLLYLRSHWLRMPMPLLVRHLSVKAIARFKERFEHDPHGEAAV